MACTEPICDDDDTRGRAAPREISVSLDDGWRGALGGRVAGGALAGRIVGNQAGGVYCVLGGISAGRFIASEDGVRGWWPKIAGPGLALDTDRIALLGVDWPSTGADSPAVLTPADQARLL